MGGRQPARRVQIGAQPLTDAGTSGGCLSSGCPDPPPLDDRRIVRVLPDVSGLATLGRTFDYVVPPELDGQVAVGTLVRVALHGRRVAGWVVADRVDPPPGVKLQSLTRVASQGPAPDLVELTAWAAWRWAGRRTSMLRTASPPLAVTRLPPGRSYVRLMPAAVPDAVSRLADEALSSGAAVLRLPPASDTFSVVVAAASAGPVLVVDPSVASGSVLVRRLRGVGLPVAALPREWAQAAAGGSLVVGARAAAWAPCPDLAAVLVLDAHDEALVEERAPAWSAWAVAAERARRAGVPCVLVSPCPTLEQLAWGRLVVPDRTTERSGWPVVHIIDRRREDPRTGLFSERLVGVLRAATDERRVVCLLNRKGRARLLACGNCGNVADCERCGRAVEQIADERTRSLRCRACGLGRPSVCRSCGGQKLKILRAGVSRVREELEALAGMGVGEVTVDAEDVPSTALIIGTEAVLHRLEPGTVGTVVFLDTDAELLAPRFRAAEHTLALLARAARLVGGRAGGGTLVAQTRIPGHPVLAAALRADPGRLAEVERSVRESLQLPPVTALAQLSGESAEEFVRALRARAPAGVEIGGPDDGRFLVRARDHAMLADALAGVVRPPGRLRVDVDPLRI